MHPFHAVGAILRAAVLSHRESTIGRVKEEDEDEAVLNPELSPHST